jgi:hypothetical protein
MAHQTIRDTERLTRLSDGKCDLNDVNAIIDRVVAVATLALTTAPGRASKASARIAALSR